MERRQLLEIVKPGEILAVGEYKLPNSYYYVLGNAYACSANFSGQERIRSREGKVLSVEEKPRGFYVAVELDE